MIFNVEINWMSILISLVLSFILGFVWYGPMFGKLWMKLEGLKNQKMTEKQKKAMPKKMLINILGTFILVMTMNLLIRNIGVSGFGSGALVGLVLSIGFILSTTILGSVLWQEKPWALFVLNGAYWIINLAIIAGILASF